MSYAAHSRDLGSFVSQPTGILRRIFDAFMETRQRDVDRQITRILAARSGGTLTDNLEREISHLPLTSNWSVTASPYSDRRFP